MGNPDLQHHPHKRSTLMNNNNAIDMTSRITKCDPSRRLSLFGLPALILVLIFALARTAMAGPLPAPYPYSTYITNIFFDFTSLKHYSEKTSGGDGSDTWPGTWGGDDSIYTAYGDGYGFSGSFSYKASWGVSKVAGPITSPTNTDIYYGPQNSDNGKVCSMLAVGLTNLYGIDSIQQTPGGDWLLVSTNLGVTWATNNYRFGQSTNFSIGPFIQYGKGNAGAPGGYIYMYGGVPKVGTNGGTILIRVLPTDITNVSQYQFVTNIDANNQAHWGSSFTNAVRVFDDTIYTVDGLDCDYDAGLGRYLLSEVVITNAGWIGEYEGVQPWGPWRTLTYQTNWGGYGGGVAESSEMTGFNFPTKWMSADGKSLGLFAAPYGTTNATINDQLDTMNVTLSVATLSPPVVTGTVTSGSNLILTGVSGYDYAMYQVMSSTNLSLPLSSWTPISTNYFASDGSFSNSVLMNPAETQRYYSIVTP
jgi:hypothetical protein